MEDSPSKKSRRVRSMFGTIASKYDLLNRVLSLGVDTLWRRKLVQSVNAQSVLDVACGTGDVLSALARRQSLKFSMGIDFSFPMLERAELKSQSTHTLVQGDVHRLPINNKSFEAITCAFGVRNFESRPAAFDEFRRVLISGGQVSILEFFPPGDHWIMAPYRFYLRNILPLIGEWISGSSEAYNYLSDTVESFVSRQKVREELVESGFESIEFKELTGGVATLVTAELPD